MNQLLDTPIEILFVNIEQIYQRIFTKYWKLKIVEIPIQVVIYKYKHYKHMHIMPVLYIYIVIVIR